MTAGFRATDRAVLRIGGAEARDFLQNLVTNDLEGLDRGAVYAALLSPQGKYLFDFFLLPDGPDILIDVNAARAPALAQRLTLYRLRAKLTIETTPLAIVLGLGSPPPGRLVFPDPRHPDLGWRACTPDPAGLLVGMDWLDPADLTALRIALQVPETGIELIPDDSYILEMGFERLHGVDFRKGCYVGQEVTARMKHKTELRKGLVAVDIDGPPPAPGTEILADGKSAGTLHTVAGGRGLAYLRFDRATDTLTAGEARIRPRARPT